MITQELHARTERDILDEIDDLENIITKRYNDYVARAEAERDYIERDPSESEIEEMESFFKKIPANNEKTASNFWKNSFGAILPHRPFYPESISAIRYIDYLDEPRFDVAAGTAEWTDSQGWIQLTMTHEESRDFMREAGFAGRIARVAELLCDHALTLDFTDYADSAIAMMSATEVPSNQVVK